MLDRNHARHATAPRSPTRPSAGRRTFFRGRLRDVGRRLHGALRVVKYAFLIWRSGTFDARFYVQQLRGDRFARWAPIFHYLLRGTAAGLDPNPFFETAYYLGQYPDVAATGKNPFVHFLRRGAIERRAPSARFEVADSLARRRSNLGERARAGHQSKEPGRPLLAGMRMTRVIRSGLDRAADFADGQRARRLLVVDQRLPTPDQDSASVRMFAILRLLRRLGHDVTFVSDCRRSQRGPEGALRKLGIKVLRGFDAAARHLAARGDEYGVAILSSAQAAERYLIPVRAWALRAKVVYDTVDLHWVRLERCAAVTGDAVAGAESRRYRRLERLNTRCADLALTVTEQERETLLREVPGARVEVLPNVHACAGTSRGWSERSGLMFIGGFAHAPNVDGVEWFVREVLPLVHRRLPGLVLRVVGGNAPRSLKRLASPTVQVLGHVPSVAPVFEASRVFVSPLRFGAGMKGKIGHSLGHGLPVVTTSIGAEGMKLAHGDNALLADDPAAFAESVVRLVTDEALWTRLSRAGYRHVATHFSEDAALKRLAELFDVVRAEAPVAAALPALVRIRP